MLRFRKRIVVLVCSFTLFAVLFTLGGTAHAASRANYAPLNTSEPTQHMIPHSRSYRPPTPGCYAAVELLPYTVKSYSLHGHNFSIAVHLYAWYYSYADGTLGFCQTMSCEMEIQSTNNTNIPSGPFALACSQQLGANYPYTWSSAGNDQAAGIRFWLFISRM